MVRLELASDPTGLTDNTELLLAGASTETLAQGLLSSAEYQNDSNTQFVDTVYQALEPIAFHCER